MAHEEQRLIMKYVDEPGYTNDIDCYIKHGGYEDLKKAVTLHEAGGHLSRKSWSPACAAVAAPVSRLA